MLLDGEADVEVIADGTDLPGVMRHVHGHGPRVLVLDVQLPNGSAIETIRQVRDQAPDTEVVVLTMEDSPLFAERSTATGSAPARLRCFA